MAQEKTLYTAKYNTPVIPNGGAEEILHKK
jgi:hypothetical protein